MSLCDTQKLYNLMQISVEHKAKMVKSSFKLNVVELSGTTIRLSIE